MTVKHRYLLAALAAAIVAVGCMCWLYYSEFRYPNTEDGWLAALNDYIPGSSRSGGVERGTPLRVVSHAKLDDTLWLYFAAENKDNTHGFLTLERGINGRYRPIEAKVGTFPYTEGIQSGGLYTVDEEKRFICLAGDNCGDIPAFRAVLAADVPYLSRILFAEKTFDISEENFLWLLDPDNYRGDFDVPKEYVEYIYVDEIVLLDENGADVTERFRNEDIQSAGYTKSSAELEIIDLFPVLVGITGLLIVVALLRKARRVV